ncbi:MAG TPA: hypothetical protein VIZ22_05600 [Candidatus Limnocylindrales bacterium]
MTGPIAEEKTSLDPATRPSPTSGAAGAPPTDEVQLPEGTRLLHIGPPKTGTTSLQSALYAARPALSRAGVHHAGRARNPAAAAQAVTGRTSMYLGGVVPPMSRWERLVKDVRRAEEPRVIISSEFFADATQEAIRRIVHDLDPDRIHIAVTVRPLASILTSQWSQYVADGMGAPFERWLEATLTPDDRRYSPTFWVRHRHDALVARWADVVGPERVSVVVVDAERGAVLRAFERLLGLPRDMLVADPDLANRSLTLPETEAVRAFNVQFKRAGLPKPLLARVMHFGATRAMKLAPPDPSWLAAELPAWSLPETRRIAREIVDNIAGSGVRVIGDLESLALVPEAPPGDTPTADVPGPPQIAAGMAMGVLLATGEARRDSDITVETRDRELERVPLFVLGTAIAIRARDAARRRVRSLRRLGRVS